MNTVMIVEDESLVALELGRYLLELGYAVVALASKADEALEAFERHAPDLVLLDIRLKGAKDGITCAQMIRARSDLPIIYLTAFADEPTLERAAATRPSGYLIKPFNRLELAAALRIALHASASSVIRLDEEFAFDPKRRILSRNAQEVHVTKQERELLELLLDAKGGIVDFYTLENRLWPLKEPNENRRRALVARLRAKLDQRFVQTVAAQGYRLKRPL